VRTLLAVQPLGGEYHCRAGGIEWPTRQCQRFGAQERHSQAKRYKTITINSSYVPNSRTTATRL
jgi:hypothetical protein